MARTSNKRRAASDAYESDDGFVEDAPSSKRAKQSSSSSKSKGAGGSLVDTEGNTYWELSGMRRITISEFKGKKYINIREYYEKDGKDLPGKKGISLPLDQYSKLIELLPMMETTLKGMGVSVSRPNYGKEGEGTGAAKDDDEEEKEEEEEEEEVESPKKEETKNKKKNIDTTSDEDED